MRPFGILQQLDDGAALDDKFDPGPGAAASINVRPVLKEGSNNGATAPADERQLAIGGLPLSEDRLSPREAARRMIGT